MASHELIHFLLGLKLGLLEFSDGVNALFACQFDGRTLAKTIPQCLDFLFVYGSLGWVHKIDLGGFLKDLLGHLESLIEIGLNESIGELLPISCLQDELLEQFILTLGNGCSTGNRMLLKTILRLHDCVFYYKFASL